MENSEEVSMDFESHLNIFPKQKDLPCFFTVPEHTAVT